VNASVPHHFSFGDMHVPHPTADTAPLGKASAVRGVKALEEREGANYISEKITTHRHQR